MRLKFIFTLSAALAALGGAETSLAQSCIAYGGTSVTYDSACPHTLSFHVEGNCDNGCGLVSPFRTAEVIAAGSCSPSSCVPRLTETNVWNPSNREFSSKAEALSELNCARVEIKIAYFVCQCPTCTRPGGTLNNTAPGEDPLLISLADNDYLLSSFAKGVRFDLDVDGRPEKTAWTRPGGDEAFLALDRNFNGTIDNGNEIFGDETPQLPSDDPNGFRALALFDDGLNGGNQDGKISELDSIYPALLLWTDTNHDGKSQSGELRALSESVRAIYLEFHRSQSFDENGNELRYWAPLERASGSSGAAIAWNAFFVTPPPARQ